MSEYPDHNFILITENTKTGAVTIRRADKDRNGRIHEYGEVEPSDLPIEACKLGADILREVGPNERVGEIGVVPCRNNEQEEWEEIRIPIKSTEPEPLMGADYLKTLPVGTILRVLTPSGAYTNPIVITEVGFVILTNNGRKYWDGIFFGRWSHASAETCIPWTRENEE